MNEFTPGPVVNLDDAASMLAVSVRTVQLLIKSGDLPSYRIGFGRGSIRLKVADIHAYINSKRREVSQ